MLTRRFVLCIIALALLLGAYVGYQFYESRVESDELISRPDAIQPNVAEGTELSEDADLRKPSPKADTVDLPPPKLVAGQMAYILTPDGKQIPFRIPEGMEDSKVMIFPPGTFPELEDKVEPPKLASVRYHIDDIPEGETIETYGMKLSIAQGRGISIEEVEKKMANGEIMMMSPTEHMEYLKSLGANAQVLAEIERRSKRLAEDERSLQIENGVFPPSVESNGGDELHQEQAVETLSGDFDTARDESTSPKEALSPSEAIPKEYPKSESDWAELLSQSGDDFAQGLDEDRLHWVAETLNRYGVEEGIRRIRAKDGQLADRLRRNLEKRDGRESRRSTKPPPSGNRKQPQGKAQ
jgi:hypothetical protein